MRSPTPLLTLIAAVLGACVGGVVPVHAAEGASDRALALARRIEARPGGGEVHWLEAGGRPFLGLFEPARNGDPRGAVLILHGLGRNPDWPGPVASLRRRLPDAGWDTLSIELPAPGPDAAPVSQGEVVMLALQRAAAGLAFLADRDAPAIALVGHRWGAGLAVSALQGGVPARVRALVTVAAAYPVPGPDRAAVAAVLAGLDLPVLEILRAGTLVQPRVVRDAEAPARDRVEVIATGPGLEDAGDEVFKRVRAWLARSVVVEDEQRR